MSSSLTSSFNQHLCDFLDDIGIIFPDDIDIKLAKKSFAVVKKVNPKMIICAWKTHIYDVYKEQIDANDFNFFVQKNYEGDINSTNSQPNEILQIIERLREPISKLSPDNKAKCMQYIFNLSTISKMYHANK
jgi:hypothetical protein